MEGGKKVWYFADGYLPAKVNNGAMEPHEALMFLNTHDVDAQVVIDVYYSDREAVKGIKVTAQLKKSSPCVWTIRMISTACRSRC